MKTIETPRGINNPAMVKSSLNSILFYPDLSSPETSPHVWQALSSCQGTQPFECSAMQQFTARRKAGTKQKPNTNANKIKERIFVSEAGIHYGSSSGTDDSNSHQFNDPQNDGNEDDLIGMVAHDLKSPISQIMLINELLESKIENLTEEQHNLFRLINNACKNATATVNDLQGVHDAEQNAMNLTLEEASVKDFFTELCTIYTKWIVAKNMMLEVAITNEAYTMLIDKQKITRVLDNLISNAMKFSSEEQAIHLTVFVQQGKVNIVVTDYGIGIPKELQPYMFQKFSRARRRGLNGEPSTGLGLYISRLIVEGHKGSLSFKSKIGEFTTFLIQLPCLSL